MKRSAPRAVQDEWRRRVEAEYRSAAITQHLVLWLIQIGAAPDLIEMGLRIVRDELAHASGSHRVLLAAGGDGATRLVRETLSLRRHERDPLEFDVVRTCVDTFCLGETVAVPLFAELRKECSVAPARKVLDRILRDEVRHRDFGWTLLAWMLEQPMGEMLRALVVRELPAMLAGVRRSYAPGGELSSSVTAETRAWGLMAGKRYGTILERTVERDYVPRFAKLGIDATRAWDAASASP